MPVASQDVRRWNSKNKILLSHLNNNNNNSSKTSPSPCASKSSLLMGQCISTSLGFSLFHFPFSACEQTFITCQSHNRISFNSFYYFPTWWGLQGAFKFLLHLRSPHAVITCVDAIRPVAKAISFSGTLAKTRKVNSPT